MVQATIFTQTSFTFNVLVMTFFAREAHNYLNILLFMIHV